MIKLRIISAVLLIGLLVGCGDKSKSPTSTTISPQKSSANKSDNIELLNADAPQICGKINGITDAFAEGVSDRYKISVRSVAFLRSKMSTDGSLCSIIVDTPEGTKDCSAGSAVVAEDGKYLAHPYSKKKDAEGYYYVGGFCL